MPVAPTVLRAAFSTILLSLRRQIVAYTGLNANRVLISIISSSDVPHLVAEQDVIIAPGAERPKVPIIDGAGRFDNRRVRKVKVTQRTRLYHDATGQDIVNLTDATDGHLALEDKICDALELWADTDDDGNALCLPVRVGDLSAPTRGTGRKADAAWAYSDWQLDIEYVRALDISII